MLNRMLIGTFSKMAFEKFPKRSKQLATQLSQGNTLGETVLAKAERRGQDPYVLGTARGLVTWTLREVESTRGDLKRSTVDP